MATDVTAAGHDPVIADEEHELRTKPRGFFADQFEVCFRLMWENCGRLTSILMNRTRAITTHIMMVLVRKYGDRQVDV
jgi:hypothetical protein